MKAIVVEKPFSISIKDVPRPTIKHENEVLIRVISGGICGSDIGIYNGTNSLASYPRIIGHEFGGYVEQIGKEVTQVAIGDFVAVDPVCSCGTCYACTHNRHNVCSSLTVRGVHEDGGFAEYVVVSATQCYKIDPKKMDPSYVCLVEPFSVGMQVNCRANTGAGDTVLVMGSGPIGMCVMLIAKQRGAKVIMTDIVQERLELAQKCGADLTVNVSQQDIKPIIDEITNREGVTVAVDTVCSLTSVPECIELVCPAGRVIVLGLKDKPSDIPQVNITKKEVDVLGSRLNNYRFPEVISLFEEGKIDPSQIRTMVYPFEKVEEAIQTIINNPGGVCKVNLQFSQV